MKASDRILDLGPGAGETGGKVIATGTYNEILKNPKSLTGRYLSQDLRIQLPNARRKPGPQQIKIQGAHAHNLKNIDLSIPLHMIVAITGVSGSGKSTLLHDVLYHALAAAKKQGNGNGNLPTAWKTVEGAEYIDDVVLVDQSPIGRTPRSNPVTYIKAFDGIRELFASLPEAQKRGFSAGHFSFNTMGGRCDRCEGSGVEKLEMYFFEDIYATCEACDGQRFKPNVLSIHYRGKTIHDVLQMTAEEALGFFSGSSKLTEKLHLLSSIGLGYLRLGQSATTLSGGEAQRLKIAAELKVSSAKNVLYIMDEPTTGLHVDDIKKLLAMLQKLVHSGNTVIVVEHNLDVIKTADWIIDLGPEGGAAGGQIVAEGRPEQVAKVAASHTGRFLAPLLASEQTGGPHL